MNKNIVIALVLLSSLAISIVSTQSVNAQFLGSVYIAADGSVVGTNSIQQVGSTYTLTANISGTIQVQKNNIIINGSGYTVNGMGEIGIDLTDNIQHDPTQPTISNITIENLYIVNCGFGILTNGGGRDTFYDDYISNCTGDACIMLIGSSYNNITYCTIDGSNASEAIGLEEGSSYNSITDNNIINGVNLFLSTGETVDRNYWSDYLTRYPNATEIGNTGIGNTPYVFSTAQNGSETVYYQDNHPLMQPVTTSQSTIPEFPSWIILPIFIVATLLSIIFSRRRITKNDPHPSQIIF
jgi:hypothetical protein